MVNVHFEIDGQHASCKDNKILASGSKNYLNAVFEFSPEWDDLCKTAIFERNGVKKYKLLVDDECVIPWEVIKQGGFVCSVVGMMDGTVVSTDNVETDMQCLPFPVLVNGGYIAGRSIEPPTEDVYEQIINMLIASTEKANQVLAESIEEISVDENQHLVVITKAGKKIDFGSVKGDKGDPFVYDDFTTDQLDMLRGPQGEQGTVGPQGERGDKGDTGLTGPQGLQGDTGLQGPKGDKGEQGTQGLKGDTGETGPQGTKGDTGVQGPHGLKGDQGAQGPKGDTGETGPKGAKGETGPQGEQGLKGDTGAGFKVLGYYDTSELLNTSVNNPSTGDAYGVGVSEPYDIYVFDGVNSIWVNNGPLQGAKGDKGEPGTTQYSELVGTPTKVSAFVNDAGYLDTSEMGANNGVATLDDAGKVQISQLPSYVDDVLEFTCKDEAELGDTGVNDPTYFPTTGESGKIYVDTLNNLAYRWSGTQYTQISPSIALGETASTAYPGDKGKATTDGLNTLKTTVDTLPTKQYVDAVKNDIDYANIKNKPTIPTVPTAVSAFTNDSGYLTAHQDISGKVDKVEGMGLSSNDFTTAEKTRLSLTAGRTIVRPGISVAEVFNSSGGSSEPYGNKSHSEGENTHAYGAYAHTEGQYTTAHGSAAHAEGIETIAYGDSTHVEGCGSQAGGANSHAEGYQSYAYGVNSHAGGERTIASGASQTVIGKFNIEDAPDDRPDASPYANYAFIIGNGTGPNLEDRSNAFTVDWNGNVEANSKRLATEEYVDSVKSPKFTKGTGDLTPGVSALANDVVYFVYE